MVLLLSSNETTEQILHLSSSNATKNLHLLEAISNQQYLPLLLQLVPDFVFSIFVCGELGERQVILPLHKYLQLKCPLDEQTQLHGEQAGFGTSLKMRGCIV